MIAIVDYGVGNLRSVFNSLTHLGFDSCVTDDEAQILAADKIILPGVGSFGRAMEIIRQKRLDNTLKQVFDREKPILGICLGMQLLLDWGLEDGMTKGLGLIPGHVQGLTKHVGYKIPHIGFNKAIFNPTKEASKLFTGLASESEFYFVHSYRVCCDDTSHVAAETIYGEVFTSAVRLKHVYGVQFHPEKSRDHGLVVLNNFALSNHINLDK
jgi:glutamine amidotransferase